MAIGNNLRIWSWRIFFFFFVSFIFLNFIPFLFLFFCTKSNNKKTMEKNATISLKLPEMLYGNARPTEANNNWFFYELLCSPYFMFRNENNVRDNFTFQIIAKLSNNHKKRANHAHDIGQIFILCAQMTLHCLALISLDICALAFVFY